MKAETEMSGRITAALSALCVLVATAVTAAPPIRIMPLGDSITYGVGAAGGYRDPLYHALTNLGYNVDFVGTQTANGDSTLPDSDHEGHSGWTIGQLDSNILSWFSAINDPDVILVHIGTNDSGASDFSNRVDRLNDLVSKMATNRPYAHIIVTSLMIRSDTTRYTAITNLFNPFVPGKVAGQQALGRRVTFLDMHAYLGLADMGDGLHPNQTGYDKMAAAWLPAITNVISPLGDWAPPALVRATNTFDYTHVTVTFSKPVSPASATNIANYALDGGSAISSASLGADQRTVVLTTSRLAKGRTYTLTANNVADQSSPVPLAITANSTSSFVVTTPRGYSLNVPESAGYQLVYSIDLPTAANYKNDPVGYSVDNSAMIGPWFGRVAYYLELQTPGGDLQYVWASMDAFTNSAAALGIPTLASGVIYQCKVSHLNVFCNVPGVTTGTGLSGNLEFWPSNYDATNNAAIPGASISLYDFGDHPTAGTYGCMQLHNYAAGQTLFALNNWGGSGGNLCVGIGNCTSPVNGGVDWTFAANAPNFTVRTLQVLVLPADVDRTPPRALAAQSGLSGSAINVTFSEPIAASSVIGACFTLDHGVDVISATLLPDLRTVVLSTTRQPAATQLTLTITGIRDCSPSANPIAPDSALPVQTYGVPPEVAANAGPLASGYRLVYTLDIPLKGNFNSTSRLYRFDDHTASATFDRIAYYAELVKTDGTTQYLWAAMDAFTNDLGCIGVPTAASKAVFQQYVTNLDVRSNVSGVTNGTGMSFGNIEFWPSDYSQGNALSITNASATYYDFGDTRNTSGSHGSMQIHNAGLSQVLFAMNNWGADNQVIALGIGNRPGSNDKDWTQAANSATYTRRILHVLVRPTFPALPPEVAARVPDAAGYQLAYTVDLPVTGSFNTNSPAYYLVNNYTNGLATSFSRIAYYLDLVPSGSTSTQFIWTAMDAFTTDARKIAIPTNNCFFQQKVTRLDVLSNVGGIANGTDIDTGNIEIWPSNYTATNSLPIPNAGNLTYDIGDGGASGSSIGYGCLQVHNYGPSVTQTLFAVNNFNNNQTLCIGIGNCTNPVTGGVDWTFKNNAGAYAYRRLHVFVLPSGTNDITRPTLTKAMASRTLNKVALAFSEPLSDDAATPSFFTLSGASVLDAKLLSSKRDVELFTTPLVPAQPYTVSVSGVRDRAVLANAILPGSAATFTTPAVTLPAILTNVSEIACEGYELIYQLAVSNTTSYAGGAPYTVDESRFPRLLPFDRVAYCMELVTNGVCKWVYVSMDAYTMDITKVGVPTADRGALWQQYVSNLNVYASENVANITVTTGTRIASGNIEFWPSNYGASNDKNVPGANPSTYDFGDGGSPSGTTAGHGSMQIHNYLQGHTIFSMVHFGNNNFVPGLGIGNNPVWTNNDPDWTFTFNAATYSTKNLYVLVRTGNPSTLSISGTLPSIIANPVPKTVRKGETAVFSVYAAGATAYQWRHNGKWIEGAVSSWLEIGPAEGKDAGTYDVLVYGSGTACTASLSATLTVYPHGTRILVQ